MVAVITIFLTIFLLIFSFVIQDFLTEYFYSIGLADYPPGGNPIPLLQVLLLPILIPILIYLSRKFVKGPKKFSILFLKIIAILAVFLTITFFVWNYFVPQVVPQIIFDDTKKALEEKDFSKVIFRYGRIAKLYPGFAEQTRFKEAQKQVEAMVLNSKDILVYAQAADKYRQLGNYNKALEILQKGLELGFENVGPKTIYHVVYTKELVIASFYEELGLVYYDLGQADNAVEAFEKAFKFYPELKPTQEYLKLLQNKK